MWILFAFGSALFAGLTAILAKCGIRNTDSNVATALRTGVVLVFSWLMVFVVVDFVRSLRNPPLVVLQNSDYFTDIISNMWFEQQLPVWEA